MALGSGFGSDAWAQEDTGVEVRTEVRVDSESGTRRVFISSDDSVVVVPQSGTFASRDSLMIEIRRYSHLIETMRDSLYDGDFPVSLSNHQKELIRENIDEISMVIDRITEEISQLELEISDNTISLLNESGEGIIINIPENLDEHLSEGFHVLTQMILSELPDSIGFDGAQGWDWTDFIPEPPAPPRKKVHGNIIKVGDDIHIVAKEDVRGHVVVIFGNAEISGRVEGNVVTLFGNLLLDDTSEVTGKVISIGGGLDQAPGAEAHDIISVDLWRGAGDYGLAGIFDNGFTTLLIRQGTFLLTLLLAMVAIMLIPRGRLESITSNLRRAPGPALGMGVVAATLGHLVALLLIAILVLTVIGVPLALLVFLALMVAVVLAVGVSGATIGGRICGLMGQECKSPWLSAVVGIIALHMVSFLGNLMGLSGSMGMLASTFLVLGVAIKALAFFFGLGALVMSRLGTKPAS